MAIKLDMSKVYKHARHVNGLFVWTEDIPPHLRYVPLADYS